MFNLWKIDLAMRMLELINPENKENIILIIKKLIRYQNKTRIINSIFKYLIKYINAQVTTTSHLIY